MSRLLAVFTGIAIVATASAIPAERRPDAEPERFTAMAVEMGDLSTPRPGVIEIVVMRWPDRDERDMLLGLLCDRGPAALFEELKQTRRVGYVRAGDGSGYDLHFAQETRGIDGERFITLVTDRQIGRWETRGLDFPFTVIELRVDRAGDGDGTIWMAAAVSVNPEFNSIGVNDYAVHPLRLRSVRAIAGGRRR